MVEKKPIGEKHMSIGMTTAKKFEKMESHANQHELPTETLNDFTSSNFNKDGSSSTYIWPQGIHTDLIKLVIAHLQFPSDIEHLLIISLNCRCHLPYSSFILKLPCIGIAILTVVPLFSSDWMFSVPLMLSTISLTS